MSNIFQNSTILITGGTGTFGSAFLNHLLELNPKEIRIFSRDEKKQYELSNKLSNHKNIKFCIGDVRDFNSVDRATKGVDYVLHAAAMKQVPCCEQNPIEALKTNVLGSNNILEASIKNEVKKVVCISTDKAVNPSSVMGLTKLYMEKLALSKAREQNKTKICIARFCNLIYSNGSVVPLFVQQIKDNKPLTVTNPKMIRYFITIKQAVDLIQAVFSYGENGEIYIKDGKPCYLSDLVSAVLQCFNKQDYPIKYIGERQGEKVKESLYTQEEIEKLRIDRGCLIIGDHGMSISDFDKDFLTVDELCQIIEEEINETSCHYS